MKYHVSIKHIPISSFKNATQEIINQITNDFPIIHKKEITKRMLVDYWQKLFNVEIKINSVDCEYNYLQWDTEQHYILWLLKYS